MRWLSTFPVAFAAGDLSGERVEPMRPEAAELVEPGIHLPQRRGIDGIDAARAVDPHAGEAGVAQHLEVLRHCRLGDAELALDDSDNVARAMLAAPEQLQDAAPDRIAQDVEGVHQVRSLRLSMILSENRFPLFRIMLWWD